jgi:hypothetical protein
LNVEYASLSHTEFVGLLKKKEENSEVSVSSPFLHCPEEVIEQKRSADGNPGKGLSSVHLLNSTLPPHEIPISSLLMNERYEAPLILTPLLLHR